MKCHLKLLLTILMLIPGDLLTAGDGDAAVWALAYFRQRYPTRVEIDADGTIRDVPLADPMRVEKLHLALSTDGRNWVPMAGNEPIWDQRLRDPFIQRAPDGLWHLVATGRGSGDSRKHAGPVCLYATSRDLIHWDDVRALSLMDGVRGPAGQPAGNIWAPEWFLDRKTGDFVLLWSSSFEDAGWKNSRLWFSRTRDWKSFTPAKVLFDPGYSVIDGSLQEMGGIYHLFHKEEEFGQRTGERRAIRLATAAALEGPYTVHEGPLNQGQIVPTITEGCAVMRDPLRPGWLLYYDYCMTNRFGLSSSADLIHWKVVDDVTFPPDARHGSVFPLSAEEAERLRTRFPAPRETQKVEP